MAVMDALLRIKADVQGEGQVQRLGTALGGLNKTAAQVSGGFRGLAGAAGNVVGGLQALLPLASGAGLVALAQKSIDTGDKLFDMSQKTGVAVEQLSRLSKAGKLTGVDLDQISKSIVKFSRALIDGKADGALKELGVSSTDASGKLRATDQIILDIADKFAKMPDGAQKTALAMQLFGKAGADMVPLLNMGRQEIEKFTGMSAKFAEQADRTSDSMIKMQAKIGAIGGMVAQILMPAMEAVTNTMTVVLDLFIKLPGPIQGIIGAIGILSIAMLALAPAMAAIVTIGTSLAGLGIGATIAGWAGAIVPAVAGITTALSGLLAWMTSSLLPGLITFFSGPVGWTVLAVAAVVAMAIAFREPIGKFFTWLGEAVGKVIDSIAGWLEPIGKALSEFWAASLTAAGKFFEGLGKSFTDGLKAASDILYNVFVKPFIDLWDNVLRDPISDMLSWLSQTFRGPFEAVVNFIRGIFNGLLQSIENGINGAIGAVNRLIGAYNSLPVRVGTLPYVPTVDIPQFAQGGVVDRPTLAMVGEGGEREYIIPESKMAAASARYLSGGRGDAVLSGGAGNSIINIRTGPVMSAQGQQWVTMADLERAVRQTEAGVMARIRTPAGRRALGIR